MAHPETLSDMLTRGKTNAPALGGSGTAELAYGELRATVGKAGSALAGRGVPSKARIAIVFPNGPAAAAAFLAAASSWTACPLNPAYTADEFRFALTDLGAHAVLVPVEGAAPAVTKAAADCGVPLVPVHQDSGTAGSIRIDGPAGIAPCPEPGDEALALHTSGTTARPKLVPLRHRNLCASGHNISAALELTTNDRCLSAMPLFHVHGLVAALLASLYAGGSVWCAPGFNPLRFHSWVTEADATWMTAVPTMYQTLLSRAERNIDSIAAHPFRLLRSSSAAMPTPVLSRLETVFRAPVLESYGMTEAAQQICANPPPPGIRKPGSVGPAAGPEVAILDGQGHRVGPEVAGEVAIRGANVIDGYAANDTANATAFTVDGWFRTGDWGRLDNDGYLFLEGRIKEIINRGGEKLSPAEIEDALLAHPKVREAVAFSVPHRTLGEDVAAAVVADDISDTKLKKFVSERLAAFKVPRTVLFVDELPKGPTGKVSRIEMAARLGLDVS